MLKLETEQVGRPEFPRWVIRDSHRRFFTGAYWTPDRKQALLFANRSLAETECSKIQADNTPQMLEAKVNLLIEVQGNASLSLDEIKDYLSQHARLEIDGDEDSPCSFVSVHTVIDWNSLQG